MLFIFTNIRCGYIIWLKITASNNYIESPYRYTLDRSINTALPAIFLIPQTVLYPFDKTALYFKKGNSTAILFPASSSLLIFPAHYYGYFSDSTARDMIKLPKDLQCSWDAVGSVDKLGGARWGYVTW